MLHCGAALRWMPVTRRGPHTDAPAADSAPTLASTSTGRCASLSRGLCCSLAELRLCVDVMLVC